MDYAEINLRPGLLNVGTDRQSKGFWLASAFVRGYGEDIGPVPGWEERTVTGATITGAARALLPWRDNATTPARRLAVGTHSKAYSVSESNVATEITPSGFTAGRADATTTGGYGAGDYGEGTYGTPRPDTGTVYPATVWDFDIWDEDLLGCSEDDGKIYTWDLDTGNDFVAVTNAPTNCVGMVVTPEKFLVAIRRKSVAWSDQGNNTVWTAAADNQAGDKDATTSGTFRCGRRVRGRTLIFSDVDVWGLTYRGGIAVYDFLPLGSGCGTISKGSPISHDGRCFWMGVNGFWQENGGAIMQLDCPIKTSVFDDLNLLQRSKVFAWHNARSSEIWWHYPSGSSTEIDSAVSWNYATGEWWTHPLARTAGHGANGIFDNPLLVDADNALFEHEVGNDRDDVTPYARTGPLELGTGLRVMNVLEVVGDERTVGQAGVVFYNRPFPGGDEVATSEYALGSGATSARFTARQTEMQVNFGDDLSARVGDIRIGLQPAGRR